MNSVADVNPPRARNRFYTEASEKQSYYAARETYEEDNRKEARFFPADLIPYTINIVYCSLTFFFTCLQAKNKGCRDISARITLDRSQVKSDVGGNYKKMLHYALMERDEFVSHVIDEACDGFGTRETLLIDVSGGPCFFSSKEFSTNPLTHHRNRVFRSCFL